MQSAISAHSGLIHRTKALQESIPGKIVLAFAATVLVAACAHVSLPLPFTPVPLTLQNFAVLVVGMALGPVAGFSAMVLYLAQGAMGLPMFTPNGPAGVARLLGPTAGFLFAYPLVAASAGWVVRAMRNVSSRFTRGIVAGAVATLILFACGAGWMATLLHLSASATWHMAIAPFLPGEIVKVTAAAGIFSAMQRWRQA
jgi:biotin transport system substrate-specific component